MDGLINNRIVVSTIDVPFREQLRLEQMTAKLQVTENLPFDPKDFYDLVTKPTDALLGDYPWLLDPDVRPKGASLEGFLYPATYSLRVDAEQPSTADDLVRMMLDTFIDRVGEDRLKVPEKRGLTFYQILTLASIVEREAVLDDEKAKIAGVYQNRIDRKPQVKTGLLEADPTVIYAVDTNKLDGYSEDWEKYVFWTVPDGGMRDQAAARGARRVQHLQAPRPAAGPDRGADRDVDRRRAQARHEERPQVLRRDPRGPGRPRLQQDAGRAREEARQVRVLR